MTAECRNWQEEFMDVNFVDQRLKTRFFKIMDAFAASPGTSTWAATGSRSSAKAAYRFFSNRDVSKDELLDSISRATVEKMKCADAEWIYGKYYTAVQEKPKKFLKRIRSKKRFMIWEF